MPCLSKLNKVLTAPHNYRCCWSIYLLLFYVFLDGLSFWCGHSSGMAIIHIFGLMLRQNTSNQCPSPSQKRLYLCHHHDRNTVLLCTWAPWSVAVSYSHESPGRWGSPSHPNLLPSSSKSHSFLRWKRSLSALLTSLHPFSSADRITLLYARGSAHASSLRPCNQAL